MTNKELDIEACKMFVCPNFNEMGDKCKKLGLNDEDIKRCKDIGIEYLKKTYHAPKYASIKSVIPAFIYVGANMCYTGGVRYLPSSSNMRRKVSQIDVAISYDISTTTVSKWVAVIISILEIKRI